MRRLGVLRVIHVALLSIMLLMVALPVYAQISVPTGIFGIQQIECYRHVRELNDQLYLMTARIEYATPPTNYDVSQTFIVRLFSSLGVELRTTTFRPYHNNGYDLGFCSIYFSAAEVASIPVTWNGGEFISIEGNPTLHWLDGSANTAMAGAQAYDNPVYTDEAIAANNVAANDMTLLPLVPAVDDAYYFGSSGMFNRLTVNVGQNGNWTGTYAWEYWDGFNWVTPSGLTDGTTGFTAGTGNKTVIFACPTNWRKCVVNGIELYWLRFRVVTYTAVVAQPLGTQSWVNTLAIPPFAEENLINWIDEGNVADAQERLTIRCRTLGVVLENDWGGTINLVENIAGVLKLTPSGEDYFSSSIDNLREMCPDLFADIMLRPEFPETGFVQDYYMGGDDADYDVYGNNWYAQTFTPTTAYSISGCDLKIFRVGNPGNVTVGLKVTAGNLPVVGAPDLASGTIDGNDFTTDTNGVWYEVSFTSDYAITPFPVVVARSTGATTAVDTVNHVVTLPSGIVAGELLLVVFSVDGNPVCSDGTALWTLLGQTSQAAVVTEAIFYKIAVGGDSLTVTTTVAEQSSYVAFRISGAGTPTATSATGNGINSDPPNHNPAVSANYLWIATRSGDDVVVATAAPTDYSNLQTQAAAGTNGASTNTAEKVLLAASENPGAFASVAEQWVSYTISVPSIGTYAIVVRATGGGAANYAGWRVDTVGTYAGGQACQSPDGGAVSWANIPGNDFMFNIRAADSHSMSYRNRLASQLVGTRLDMTDLGAYFNLSRMWMSTLVWIIFACMIPAVIFCRAVQSFKPATLVFAMMLPFGALAGFIYLEVAIIAAFLCASAAIFIFFYRPSP